MDRHPRFQYGVLIQITDLHVLTPGDFSFLRFQLARDDFHKRALALAVGSQQSDVFTF